MAILHPEALTDLHHTQDMLKIAASNPGDANDILIRLINTVSMKVLTQGHIGSFKYHSSTEVLDGLGSQKLITNYWPIISITSIHESNTQTFDSSSLTDSNDYAIVVGRYKDMIPNAGIIRRLVGQWIRGTYNVQVIYTSGFSGFTIMTGINDTLVIDEGGADITVTFAEGRYNAVTLATELQTKLNASGSTSNTYTVTYSTVSHRFNIASDGTLSLNWTSDGESHKELGKLLGYEIETDQTSSTSYVAPYPALGLPDDLVDVVTSIVRWRYAEVYEKRTGKSSSSRGDASSSFNFNDIPKYIRDQLKPYLEIRM